MPTGVVLYPNPNAVNVVDDVVSQARRAYELGVRQVWLAQQFDHDAIALAGLVGGAVPGLGVGTSVVPINPRHPLIVASQAQTAQAASHGNFSLGLGLGSHEPGSARTPGGLCGSPAARPSRCTWPRWGQRRCVSPENSPTARCRIWRARVPSPSSSNRPSPKR